MQFDSEVSQLQIPDPPPTAATLDNQAGRSLEPRISARKESCMGSGTKGGPIPIHAAADSQHT